MKKPKVIGKINRRLFCLSRIDEACARNYKNLWWYGLTIVVSVSYLLWLYFVQK